VAEHRDFSSIDAEIRVLKKCFDETFSAMSFAAAHMR